MSTPLFEELPQPRRSAVVVALRAHATFMDMKANIETALDEVIDDFREKKAANRKLFKKHRRALLSNGGYDVILFIWKNHGLSVKTRLPPPASSADTAEK